MTDPLTVCVILCVDEGDVEPVADQLSTGIREVKTVP